VLLELLRDFVRRRAIRSATEDVEIVSASLGERAELMAQSRSPSTAPAPPAPAPVSSQLMMEEVSMPVSTRRRGTVALVLAAMLALVVAACGSDDNGSTGTGTSSSGGGKPVALLLPESKTARYESQDRPNFERKLKSLCPDCDIIYSNADQDPAKQQQQAEAAITKGAKVLVLDPVDAASAASIVTRAKQQDVGVVSYDRLITGADIDYYISFDNVKVGQLQAAALSAKLKKDGNPTGPITMINGAPTDNNAKLFKQGALQGLQEAGVKIAKQYDTPDWSPDKAQNEMEQAITALGKSGFNGVYAANDGTAGGAIAAMKGNGIKPATKPTTGQDAELAAVQRIIAGEQYMTVYKAVKPEAEDAAQLAVALAKGQQPPAGLVTGNVDNGKKQVPSVILTPVSVTKSNVNDTIVKDGFWSVSQICTPQYASACKSAGIE
jgi:D-xylose transport system substrate-binding protein